MASTFQLIIVVRPVCCCCCCCGALLKNSSPCDLAFWGNGGGPQGIPSSYLWEACCRGLQKCWLQAHSAAGPGQVGSGQLFGSREDIVQRLKHAFPGCRTRFSVPTRFRDNPSTSIFFCRACYVPSTGLERSKEDTDWF